MSKGRGRGGGVAAVRRLAGIGGAGAREGVQKIWPLWDPGTEDSRRFSQILNPM